MEQFVLIPSSVYKNKKLNTQTVKKQELPNNLAEQNDLYQNRSSKKEISKKLFAKADSSVDRIFVLS